MTASGAAPGRSRPRIVKAVILTAGIVVSALVIVAWTQPWFSVQLVDDELGGATVAVGGDVAAGGLAGLGLAGLALIGALSIAGPAFRIVLGVLQVLIGATVTLSAVVALAAPLESVAPAVTDATGVSGEASVLGLVRAATPGFWPFAAVVLGVSAIVLGILIVVTSRHWPGSSRFQPVRFDRADDLPDAMTAPGAGGGDTVADWDALSEGSDPTSR